MTQDRYDNRSARRGCSLLDTDPSKLGGVLKAFGPGSGSRDILRITNDQGTEPEVVTVSFDVVLAVAGGATQQETALVVTTAGAAFNAIEPPLASNHLIRATLTWGSYKGGGVATFDLRHGTRVSVEASSVSARCTYTGVDPAAIIGPVVDIRCSLGLGSVGKNPGLTFTQAQLALLAAATSDWVPVPQYAHALRVFSTRDPLAVPALDFTTEVIFSRNPAGVPSFVCRFVGGEDPFVLPAGSEWVRFVNSAAGAQTLTPVFELTL